MASPGMIRPQTSSGGLSALRISTSAASLPAYRTVTMRTGMGYSDVGELGNLEANPAVEALMNNKPSTPALHTVRSPVVFGRISPGLSTGTASGTRGLTVSASMPVFPGPRPPSAGGLFF